MAAVSGREFVHAMLGLRAQLQALEQDRPTNAMERWQRWRALRFVKHEVERGRVFIREAVPAMWSQHPNTD